jgi:hypothetical protein
MDTKGHGVVEMAQIVGARPPYYVLVYFNNHYFESILTHGDTQQTP